MDVIYDKILGKIRENIGIVKSPSYLKQNNITPLGDFHALYGQPSASQTKKIILFEDLNGDPYFYLDATGDYHIGWKAEYTTGGLRYRDSRKLWFDTEYFGGGVRNTYIECVPNIAGVQNQHKMRFVLEGSEMVSISTASGFSAPNGATISGFNISGQTLRSINSQPLIIRGEFNTITLRAEIADVAGNGAVISNFADPFGSTPRANGDIHQFQNANALKARVGTFGEYISLAGKSTDEVTLGGRLYAIATDVSNSGTGETDLYSYTTKANTLWKDNQSLDALFAGIIASSINNKRLIVYFGGTSIFDSTALAITGASSFKVLVNIIRTSSSTARAIVSVQSSDALLNLVTETDLTGLSFTGTNVLKLTGTGGASTEITAKFCTINWNPAPVV